MSAKGIGLAAISYDPVEVLALFASQHGIAFPLLSDVGSVVIKRFEILNPVPGWALGPEKDDPEVQSDVRKYVSVFRVNRNMVGIAFPGTFIVDAEGRVKERFFEDFYIERNTASNLLIKLGGKRDAAVPGTKISSAHLEITTYPSSAAIAPGDRFSVVTDVEPYARIHVYAPGAKGYRVIALHIETNPQVRVLAPQYPPSEDYFFKPLNEHVPVFQKPFRLVQELVLEGTPEAQAALRGKDSVIVRGSLEYQACNDKECYNPVSMPLTWTLTLRPLITQRGVASR